MSLCVFFFNMLFALLAYYQYRRVSTSNKRLFKLNVFFLFLPLFFREILRIKSSLISLCCLLLNDWIIQQRKYVMMEILRTE